MKSRKWISLFLLVAILVASVALPMDATASAVNVADNTIAEQGERKESGDQEEESPEKSTNTTLGDTQKKDADLSNQQGEQIKVQGTEKVEDSSKTDTEEKQSEEEIDDSAAHVPQARSLQPLKEVKAYLVLNDKTTDQLKNMSIDEMLNSLQDKDGNKIEVSKSATTVWRYVKDDLDNIERYDSYTIGSGEVFDLSAAENVTDYQLEIIVGKGNQLSADNVRYIIKVYISDNYNEEFSFELYAQPDSSTRYKIEPSRVEFIKGEPSLENYIPQWNYFLYGEQGTEIKGPHLGISSVADENPNIDIEIYRAEEFLVNDRLGTEVYPPVTDQVLDQEMDRINAGYKLSAQEAASGVVSFIVVYYLNDVQMDLITLNFFLLSGIPELTGSIYTLIDDEKVNVADDIDVKVEFGENAREIYYFTLDKGYSAENEYYVSMNALNSTHENVNDKILKAVVGSYSTIEETTGLEDIKDSLFSDEGYKANYGGEGIDVTVFFEDANTFGISQTYQFKIRAVAAEDVYYSYTEKPIIGAQDPWFRVTGANYENEAGEEYVLDTYVVENGKNINMDTMYGYGYQTVLINDLNIDLTKVKPVFWTEDSEQVTDVRVVDAEGNQKKITSGDVVNCNGTVQFIVTIDGHQKNYMVNFVKKFEGAKLFVAGPAEREVFLDEYFEYKHDIFIANVGIEPLTGLKVELNATNCKLDDYWTVGGEGNATLAAFSATSSGLEYGESGNIAKIRLIPDGEGDIEGTIKISADGQEPVIINLSGRAQNPKITTEDLDDAVKYVPYSYMVTTNNMYDWTDVNFTLSGELPEGVEFIEETGEIYGVPQEMGTFPVTVTADFTSDTYEFESSTVELTLNVQDNTNTNVYESTDSQYQILESIGEDVTGEYDFVLTEIDDQLFVSNGEFDEFQDLWLNGEKLVDGVDYTKEEGSTRITISSQTFENKVNKDGTNTLAAEFRVDNERENELKRTAQNFRLDLSQENPSDNTSDDQKNPTGDDDGQDSGGNRQSNKNTGGNQNTGNSSYNGKRVIPARNTGSSGNGSSVDTDTEDQSTVTMYTQLVDAEDSPLENYTIEIHSTPKEAVTNEKGVARFNDVEFGSHTITVKASDGITKATKKIKVEEGDELSLNDNVITAKADSAFTLKIMLDEDELKLMGVEERKVLTGDFSNYEVWLLAFLLAGVSLAGMSAMRGKRVKSLKKGE